MRQNRTSGLTGGRWPKEPGNEHERTRKPRPRVPVHATRPVTSGLPHFEAPDQFSNPADPIIQLHGAVLQFPSGELDETQLEQLRAAQAYELDYAAALYECGFFTTIPQQVHEIRLEYKASS